MPVADLPQFIRDLPEAGRPAFDIVPPNVPLELFQGRFVLRQGRYEHQLDGRLVFHWDPHPILRLSGVVQSDLTPLELADVNVSQPQLHLRSIASVAQVSYDGRSTHVTCRFYEPVSLGANRAVRRVRFHLPNFPCYAGAPVRYRSGDHWATGRSRLTLATGPWVVDVDQQLDCESLKKSLRVNGGVGIGHVGTISRLDGAPFKYDEVSDLLGALHYFFSFARGAWSGPILVVGDGVSKPALWTRWRTWRITPWRDRASWFPEFRPGGLNEAFRGFMEKWNSTTWHVPVCSAIHWLVEANIGAGALEGGIVMACTALEMLGWVRLVEERQALSPREFNRLNADEKMRRLLSDFSIPATVPHRYKALRAFRARHRLVDGPASLVKLRNAIVHPKKAKRRLLNSTARAARFEAKHLALMYVELALLGWFEYDGHYERRRFEGWVGESTALVPWAPSSERKQSD